MEAKKGNYREIVAFSLEDEVSYSAFILHFIDNWQHNLHEKNEIHKNIYSVFFLQKKDIVAARIDTLTDEYHTGIRNITRDYFNYDDNNNSHLKRLSKESFLIF